MLDIKLIKNSFLIALIASSPLNLLAGTREFYTDSVSQGEEIAVYTENFKRIESAVPSVDVGNKRQSLLDIVTTGWVSSGETWTYASATTFTISTDKTGKYQKGDKLKLTQTTAKYFYIVVTPTYSSGTGLTTITVSGGSDYTLANAAITSPYYSKVENPQSFPQWFNTAAPTWNTAAIDNGTGGQQPTTNKSRFVIRGRVVTVYLVVSGTKNTAGNNTPFDPSAIYPAWGQSTGVGAFGSCFDGTNGYFGLVYYVSTTDYRFFFTGNIPDNTVISVSATFSYEI